MRVARAARVERSEVARGAGVELPAVEWAGLQAVVAGIVA